MKIDEIKFIDITPENVDQAGIYCIKNEKSPGRNNKISWFKTQYQSGLRMIIAQDRDSKQVGFIEYTQGVNAWRPVIAREYLFIQCTGIFVKKAKGIGIATKLIHKVLEDAKSQGSKGVCTICSDGAWIANKSIFEKCGFKKSESRERYDLLVYTYDSSDLPVFIDWTKERKKYRGWWLFYADQCPWHDKSVTDINAHCKEMGIPLQNVKITSPEEAQQCPSGYGTYALIKDGNLLADHYISLTRFKNIVRKEL